MGYFTLTADAPLVTERDVFNALADFLRAFVAQFNEEAPDGP